MALEEHRLAEYPEEEAEARADPSAWHVRGSTWRGAQDARVRARLNVLAREELGLNPDDLGSASGAAGFSFVCFSVGALVPLLPFLLGRGGITAAGVLRPRRSLARSFDQPFYGPPFLGGVRMLAIGAGAAGITMGSGICWALASG